MVNDLMKNESNKQHIREIPTGKIWLLFLVLGSLIFLVLTAVIFYTVSPDRYPVADADRQILGINQWLSPVKYIFPLLVLVLGDVVVVKGGLNKGKRMLVLWLPFLLFFVMAVVHWGFVGDAYMHFQQRNDLWLGWFSGAVIFLAFSLTAGLGLSVVNILVIL